MTTWWYCNQIEHCGASLNINVSHLSKTIKMYVMHFKYLSTSGSQKNSSFCDKLHSHDNMGRPRGAKRLCNNTSRKPNEALCGQKRNLTAGLLWSKLSVVLSLCLHLEKKGTQAENSYFKPSLSHSDPLRLTCTHSHVLEHESLKGSIIISERVLHVLY